MTAVFVGFLFGFPSLFGALQLHAALAIPLVPVHGPNYVQTQGIQGSPLCSRFGGLLGCDEVGFFGFVLGRRKLALW